jgi:RNA 2',3'-cyclic 3'-phosphodiesterase
MNTIRAFIAIELSPAIHQALNGVMLTYKRHALQAVHWVPEKNIHLTLRFLGDSSPQQVEKIKQSSQSLVQQYPALEINVEGSGVFPNLKHPRVIWVATQIPDSLKQLQTAIENNCRLAGFDPDTRPFSPHLTLGRVSPNASSQDIEKVIKAMNEVKVGNLGQCKIERVTFFKSDLNPSGPLYTPLAYFPLKLI